LKSSNVISLVRSFLICIVNYFFCGANIKYFKAMSYALQL
jgi:hypothetical protein